MSKVLYEYEFYNLEGRIEFENDFFHNLQNPIEVTIKNNIATVHYKSSERNNFLVHYKVIEFQEIIDTVIENQEIDLTGRYIEYLDLDSLPLPKDCLLSIIASFCYSDGELSFSTSYKQQLSKINFNYSCFSECRLDFDESSFYANYVVFDHSYFINSYINFRKTNFESCLILFADSSFYSTSLVYDYAKMTNTDFSFENVVFDGGKASYTNTHFGKGTISFSQTRFLSADVTFENANFGDGHVDFSSTDFSESIVLFKSTSFGTGSVLFLKTIFNSTEVNFNFDNLMGTMIIFNDIDFSVSNFIISINQTSYSRDFKERTGILFRNIVFSTFTLNVEYTSLPSLEIYDTIFLSYSYINLPLVYKFYFHDSTIEKLMTIKCSIYALSMCNSLILGQLVLDWDKSFIRDAIEYAYGINGKNQFGMNPHKDDMLLQKPLKERQYLASRDFLLLKENFNRQGKYEVEDQAYNCYMKYYSKSIQILNGVKLINTLKSKKLRIHILKNFGKKIFNLVFGCISGYGTRLDKILLTCISTIIIFSAFYINAFLDKANILRSVFKSLYFSTITFLTIGYGDISPIEMAFSDFQTFCTGIEGFLGLLLMSMVTVVVVRKVLR